MYYTAASGRYNKMLFRRCGNSGLDLPAVSLGLWHNFGHVDQPAKFREILFTAFDAGITHFDLANNYGPPPGAAEENFGKILSKEFRSYRDEMIIATKAGHYMWPGPYGDKGSRKYLLASLDQSLIRLGLDYVDIFYHHCPDDDTPLEESMVALDRAVRSGKALYVGISKYPVEKAKQAVKMLKSMGTPCLVHQTRYSMLDRGPENGLLDVLDEEGVGCIAFSPLKQGVLTSRYIDGIPEDSRAAKSHGFLQKEQITSELLSRIRKLKEIAEARTQSLAQMALAWILKDIRLCSVLVGASSVEQLHNSLGALDKLEFREEELEKIENILKS